MIILAKFNETPWDIEAKKITFKELYEKWKEKKAPKLGKHNRAALINSYKHCKRIENMKYYEIRSYHMQECIDECGLGASTQSQIKNLFGHLDNFAFELDIINKRYSELIHTAPTPETSKKIFTDEEVNLLWENQNLPWVDSILFFLYTGFRITEMIELKTESVDLSDGTITGGIKTRAGRNRIVPIHSKIFHIVKSRMEESKSGYLFEFEGKPLSDKIYRKKWNQIMKNFKMKHTPHECRHTLRSRLDTAGANKVCIDRIMGHKSGDVGERVYTHKTISELKANIELVTN